MKVTKPGVKFYAREIKRGNSFTLIRYGEGEWRCLCPSLPPKFQDDHFRGPRWMRRGAEIWSQEENRAALRQTLLEIHRHPRYFLAAWHLKMLHSHGWLALIDAWLEENGLEDLAWHNGRIWRQAVGNREMWHVLQAIKEQPLPIVVVAPEKMRSIENRLSIAEFVVSPHPNDLEDVETFVERVTAFDQPSFVIFCAAVAGKIAIHRLFPLIGEKSFLIDFGAALHGLCGENIRRYHAPQALTATDIEFNWEGPS